MIIINRIVKINHYNFENKKAFRSFLNSSKLVKEFQYLSIQKFKSGKNIFLLVEENNGFMSKLIAGTKEKIIGYCIVEHFQQMDLEFKPHASAVFKIPLVILDKYPLIISDFVIRVDYRNKGYGKKLAEHILFKLYPDFNFSLYADEDGLFFWPKMGFSRMEEQSRIMYLKGFRFQTIASKKLEKQNR